MWLDSSNDDDLWGWPPVEDGDDARLEVDHGGLSSMRLDSSNNACHNADLRVSTMGPAPDEDDDSDEDCLEVDLGESSLMRLDSSDDTCHDTNPRTNTVGLAPEEADSSDDTLLEVDLGESAKARAPRVGGPWPL